MLIDLRPVASCIVFVGRSYCKVSATVFVICGLGIITGLLFLCRGADDGRVTPIPGTTRVTVRFFHRCDERKLSGSGYLSRLP